MRLNTKYCVCIYASNALGDSVQKSFQGDLKLNTRNFSMALNIVLIFVVLCGLYFFRSDIFISKNNMIYDDSSTETLAKKENVDYKSLIGHKQHNWMPKIFIDKFEINMSLDAFIKLVDIQLKKEDFKRNLDTIFQFDTDRNALLSQLEIQQMNISDQAEINRYVDIINTFKRIDLK